MILQQNPAILPAKIIRTTLNGYLEEDRDSKTESLSDLKPVTKAVPTKDELNDLVFANKIAKHTKSNTIVLAKNGQLLASGVGQTSRVDALKQAILKAKTFGFDLKGSVMASDAFFPFADCVEIAHDAGVTAAIQPGGSIKDKDSIEYCDKNNIESLIIQNLDSLQYLSCSENQLTSLNTQDLTNLLLFHCKKNQLNSLNIQNSRQLYSLDCSENQLISLYIKNGSHFNYVDFSVNPNLTYICCDDEEIVSIQNIITDLGLTNCIVDSNFIVQSNCAASTQVFLHFTTSPSRVKASK